MNETEKFLIVGLGNPGVNYQGTRHNVGFQIVQQLAEKNGAAFKHASFLNADLVQTSIEGKGVFILLPTTYMNLSGEAVKRCVDYFKLQIDHLVVVCDDIALPMGKVRMRSKGSSGGHKGLESIAAHLNTEYYSRLRIGVGGPGNQILADYVLDRFTEDENKILREVEKRAIHILELWVNTGIASAMQAANSQTNESI